MAEVIGSSTSFLPLNYISHEVEGTRGNVKEGERNVQNMSVFSDVSLLMAAQNLYTAESRALTMLRGNKGGKDVELVTNTIKLTEPDAGDATSASQQRSHQAVEGGTDITPPAFINVIGSMSNIEVSNAIIKVSNDAQRIANISAAEASVRSVDAAGRAGNKMVDAAKENLNGAITSGAVGMVGQGITTKRSVGALNKESKSIESNLRPARDLERSARENQSKSPASDMHTCALKRDTHNDIQLSVNKTRIGMDYTNQAIRSGQGIIEGSFNVAASGQQKEAELARADRDVNNELANVHSQVAKKTAEANTAVVNALDNVLSTNNSTVSSMAERV